MIMRLFVSFTILLFCSLQAFSQRVTPEKKSMSQKKIIQLDQKKITVPLKSDNLFGHYNISKYYNLTKKSAKKKEVNLFLNSPIKVDENLISGLNINDLSFSIYEIEKMEKDDYLYRVFNKIISTEMAELPGTFSVHKTDLPNFFGIIQLLNGDIAFPYKGGLIIAKPSISK